MSEDRLVIPAMWPVAGRTLQQVQPPVVHQPAAVRDDLGVPPEREATRPRLLVIGDGISPELLAALSRDAPVIVLTDRDRPQQAEGWGCPPVPPVLEVLKPRPMQKLSRTMMRSWVARHLTTKQGGLCPLCRKPIDLTTKGEGVIDHDHDSGEIRGVLHRSCNAAEGKISNAAARWGAKSSSYSAIIEYLSSIVAYLSAPGAGVIYPMHKTADEKKDEKNAKVRANRAAAKAKLALRSRKEA